MNNIIVLTFHTVADHNTNRPWSFLSTSVSSFEKTLKYLKKHNYQTITLKELYEWKKSGKEDNVKRVLIHFDDGFLDNYTTAYPLLKKYGFKATVFVSPEFVDPRPIVRNTQYENIKAGKNVELDSVWGYMSWEELKKIDSEGVIDVQAHAMTHTWYPCDMKIIDWFSPNDSHYWIVWNAYPEKKPFWLTKYNEKDVPYGYPIFQYAKSISGKRFIPNQEVIDESIKFYNENNIPTDHAARQEVIDKFNNELMKRYDGNLGCFESDSEFHERLVNELVVSKKIIEEKLEKKIEFLAWPGGAVSEM
ncbi:MAG: polysaccharide deacetylase family protein, partial [Clostridiales bacterium]|nr:polysaccharide deacetylase family protein [Clostridiales bacterium]